MKKFALFTLALALSAGGCAEGLGPQPAGPPELAVFTAVREQEQAPAEPQITVAALSRGIAVDAVLAAPDGCRTLSGEVALAAPADEPVLALTVRISPTGGGCAAALGRFAYNARVTPLRPGRNRVQVWHRFDQTGNPAPVKVFDGYVQVLP